MLRKDKEDCYKRIKKHEDKVRPQIATSESSSSSSESSSPVMLSEVRRQPNGVEAPHVCGAVSAPCEGIPTTTQLKQFSDGWPILEMLSRFNSAVTAMEFP